MAVMPVGNAPVVLNATAVPFAGEFATVTTAGVAIVIVAVCVATVSSTVQLVVFTLLLAATNAQVAKAVVVAPDGAVIPMDTGVKVKLPVPTAVIFTAEPPTLVDSLMVCAPEYVPEIVVDATVCDTPMLYVPVPPAPVPKLVTTAGVTPVPVIAVPTPIEPA